MEVLATVPETASSGAIAVSTPTEIGFSSTNFVVLQDSDRDRMADVFEQQYFGTIQSGDPAGDNDGDGATHLEEYQAGTNPLDPGSVFVITQIRREGDDIVVVFRAVASKRYRVEASTNLRDGFPIVIATTPRIAADTAPEVLDRGASAQPGRFYRVMVLP